ncbi:MAG: biotin/lipoyl-containing protein [Bdellovibrionota bacterium]
MSTRVTVVVNGTAHEVDVLQRERNRVRFRLSGREYLAELQSTVAEPKAESGSKPRSRVAAGGLDPKSSSGRSSGDEVCAPMPGVIAAISVAEGAAVKRGDVLLVIEAMKMQNKIFASRDGVVKTVLVTGGEEVRDGQQLLAFHPTEQQKK